MDFGAPPPQNMQPDAIKTTWDYCYDAGTYPNVDVNHDNYVTEPEMAQMTYHQYPHGYDPLSTTAAQAMHSPSYGGYPELPSMGPTNLFCPDGPDQRYQNQEGIIPHPYHEEQVPYVQGTQHNYFQYPPYSFQ